MSAWGSDAGVPDPTPDPVQMQWVDLYTDADAADHRHQEDRRFQEEEKIILGEIVKVETM